MLEFLKKALGNGNDAQLKKLNKPVEAVMALAAEYRKLIGTYSDHITIEESIRERFFDAIEETINRHGGSISVFDTIDLQMARKP